MIDRITLNAELVIEQFQSLTDFEFGYNKESIKWTDGYINRQRQRDDFSKELEIRLISVIGSFLGQCIIECYGGNWKETEEGWAIQFDEKNMVYPFSKMAKQLSNGPEDSIYSLFNVIPTVFELNR